MRKIDSFSAFIASPGDLASERKVFRDTLEALNHDPTQQGRLHFQPVGWEDQEAFSGRRVQSKLNDLITDCDAFFLVLYTRWGEKDPEVVYTSNTEEEYRVAMDLWRTARKPEVFVFFKHVDDWVEKLGGPELTKVINFRKELQSTRQVLYKTFKSEAEFATLVRNHVQAVARGDFREVEKAPESTVTFDGAVTASLDDADRKTTALVKRAEAAKGAAEAQPQRVPTAIEQASADLSLVAAYKRDLTLARAAVDAANRGELEDAGLLFAQATATTTELPILAAAAEFYRQTGEVETATRLVQRQTAIAEDRSIAADYYLKLVPNDILLGNIDAMMEDVLPGLLGPDFQALPQEEKQYWLGEIRETYHVMFSSDHFRAALREVLTQIYTTEELLGQATFLASPVGQSAFRKQKYMMGPLSEYGKQEFPRVFADRHPELFQQTPEQAPLQTEQNVPLQIEERTSAQA